MKQKKLLEDIAYNMEYLCDTFRSECNEFVDNICRDCSKVKDKAILKLIKEIRKKTADLDTLSFELDFLKDELDNKLSDEEGRR